MRPASETEQLILLFGFSSLCFLFVMLCVMAERWYRIFGTASARFVTVNASTNLYKKIRNLIAEGVEVLIPAGQGLYPFALSAWRRRRWEWWIEQWVRKGAKITLLITSPNDEATNYWQDLVDRLGAGLKVLLLDRKLASEHDAAEIEKLDRFHPTLILKGDKRLGMWVENDHPPRSKVAYNVEYVAGKDIVDYQQARFDRYLRVLRQLTDDGRRPPHLSELKPSSSHRMSRVADAA